MASRSDILEALAKAALLTRESELACDECLAQLGPYLDAALAGQAPPPALHLVSAHLDICPECDEEYQGMLAALRDLEG